jgi:glycerol-3-phosphate dehydrogenase (NAD(P)+)
MTAQTPRTSDTPADAAASASAARVGTLERVAVVGGGAWGTALALAAARAGRDVVLVVRDPAVAKAVNERHENPARLPGLTLDPPIRATTDLSEVADADIVILAVPAQSTRAAASGLAAHLRPGTPLVVAAKGIERGSGLLLAAVAAEAAPGAVPAVLSGPSFAADVARGLPTAVTIATADGALADALAAALASPAFRPYASTDVVGVEVGGALKNVLAIACGIVVGRGLGASAQAALTARAFAELGRLAAALGGRPETVTGLSGLGDLVLTASSRQSRNFSFGIALGEGRAPSATGPLVEGALTAPVAAALAARLRVDVPITAAVAAVIDGTLSIDAAIEGLLARPLKRE